MATEVWLVETRQRVTPDDKWSPWSTDMDPPCWSKEQAQKVCRHWSGVADRRIKQYRPRRYVPWGKPARIPGYY